MGAASFVSHLTVAFLSMSFWGPTCAVCRKRIKNNNTYALFQIQVPIGTGDLACQYSDLFSLIKPFMHLARQKYNLAKTDS